MAKVYSYIRFSSRKQELGASLARQTALADAWAERHGFKIDESLRLRDLGLSGFDGTNLRKGALGGFLEAINQGRVRAGDTLLIEHIDRLSRNALDEALELFLGILRAGVKIVTLDPEFEYSRRSINDIGGIMQAIIAMWLAHEASRQKGERVADAWRRKQAKMKEEKLTARCPAWLRLSADRKSFEEIPEAVKAVKKIFAWCAEGQGVELITKRLNADGVPFFGRGGKRGKIWHKSYVRRILNSTAVIGLYRGKTTRSGRKTAVESLADYYPRIIDEVTYRKAHEAMKRRQQTGGPVGKQISNLFTGICLCARSGSPMHVVNKGSRSPDKKLVSSAAQYGEKGARYISISYDTVESVILRCLPELKVADISTPDRNRGQLEETLADEEEALAKLQTRRDFIKQKIDGDSELNELDSLLDSLKKLEGKIASKESAIEALRDELEDSTDHLLCDAQEVVKLLENASGDELLDLRSRLKGKLQELMLSVHVFVTVHKRWRWCILDIKFRAGGHRMLSFFVMQEGPTIIAGDRTTMPLGEGLDILDKKKQAFIDRIMPKMYEVLELLHAGEISEEEIETAFAMAGA